MPRPRKEPDPIHPAIELNKKLQRKRKCLKCHRLFKSACSGNRTCGRCQRILEDVRSPLTYRSELSDAADGD